MPVNIAALLPKVTAFMHKNPAASQALLGAGLTGVTSSLSGGDFLPGALYGAGLGYGAYRLGLRPIKDIRSGLASYGQKKYNIPIGALLGKTKPGQTAGFTGANI